MISLFIKFFFYRVRTGIRSLKYQTIGKISTIVVGIVLFALVGVVLYRVGVGGLSFIKSFTLYEDAFSLYVYEIYFAILFYIISFSSVLFLVFTLFRSSREDWIMTTPKYRITPIFYIVKTFLNSLIPILVLSIPMVLAIWRVSEMGFAKTILMLADILLLLVNGIFFGTGLVFIFSKLLYFISSKIKIKVVNLVTVFVMCAIVLGIEGILGWGRAFPKDFYTFWQVPAGQVEDFDVSIISDRFSYFQSHPTALLIHHLENGNMDGAVTSIIRNISFVLVSGLVVLLVSRNFSPVWQSLREGNSIAQTKSNGTRTIFKGRFPRIFRGKIGALFEKELLIRVRNFKDISWIGFIFSLWLMYSLINIGLKFALQKFHVQGEEVPNSVYALQVAVGIYFVTAFVLRFVFPSFSAERKTSWIFGTAPLNLVKVMFSKLLFFGSLFLLMGLTVSTINFVVFEVTIWEISLFLIILTVSVSLITTFGMFMGIAFPNFDSDNPEVLGTTIPGIFFTLASVLYGALGAYLLYVYMQGGLVVWILFYILASVVLFVLFIVMTPVYLREFEFTKRNFLA